MAKITLIKGKSTPTVRNFKSQLPTYLTYLNTLVLIILIISRYLS